MRDRRILRGNGSPFIFCVGALLLTEYAVISRRFFTGTIADLPYHARLAWAAILFEAERLRGRVKLPVRDLARTAAITTSEAADALCMFQKPDPFSSSKELDGIRLTQIEGEEDWYQVVTWDKHVKERESFFNRLRQQRFKTKQKTETSKSRESVTVSNGDKRSVTKEPEPEPEQKKKDTLLSATPSEVVEGSEKIARVSAPKTKADAPLFDEDAREMKAARYLFGKIRENDGKAKEPNFQKWASDFDKLFRIDGRSAKEVRAVIDWCQADDFWKPNILSAKTFRDKYAKLRLQAASRQTPPAAQAIEQERKTE